jgi:hypothetical protein
MSITFGSLGRFHKLAIVALILAHPYFASAQKSIQFRHLSIDQGLS